MTRSERAEQLMAKGPVWLVRRVMELEAEESELVERFICEESFDINRVIEIIKDHGTP